ncbi:hypothetical protein ACWDXV_30550 [Nocardia nova]
MKLTITDQSGERREYDDSDGIRSLYFDRRSGTVQLKGEDWVPHPPVFDAETVSIEFDW